MTKKQIVPSSSKGKNGNTIHSSPKKQISPAKHWCFTLNNYSKEHIKLILNICSNSSNKYIFQEEIGDNNNEHLQGYIEFTKKVRPKSLFNAIPQIHWEKTRNIQASIAYCQKQESRNGQIFSKGINRIWSFPTLSSDKFYTWQKNLNKIVQSKPDTRTIYWYWDTKGNTGKSTFCKYLHRQYGAIILSGKGNDMKYGIISYFNKHKQFPSIIILDIPRSCVDYVSYTGIEEIKNGLFFSSKYESDMVDMPHPHFICFANEPPNYNKMSMDRWKVVEIKK